jgi:hypothetical protein
MPVQSDKYVYIYLFFLDLTTLQIAQITWPCVMKRMVYNKLGSMWLEAVVVYYKTLPRHLVKETEQGYEKSQLGRRSLG